jgi:uncharacterized membrane protein YhdT
MLVSLTVAPIFGWFVALLGGGLAGMATTDTPFHSACFMPPVLFCLTAPGDTENGLSQSGH